METESFLPFQFEAFLNPVLFLRDGRISYANPAALALEPGLLDTRPGFLDVLGEPGTPGMGVCRAFSRSWQLSCAPVADGQLIFLSPIPEGGLLGGEVSRLTRQLRGPVGNLMAVRQLLRPIVEERNESKFEQYLAITSQSLYRILRLIDLADTAEAIAEDALPYRAKPLDVSALTEELGREVEPIAESLGVGFLYRCEERSLITEGNAALLRRALCALLSNAFKAAGKGGEVQLCLRKAGGRALFSVTDNGAGLPNPSGGGRGALPGPEEGVGVGLPLARQAALLHGGALLVESRRDRGVRAVLSIPMTQPKTCTLHTPFSSASPGGFSPILLAFADLLPWQSFRSQDEE